MRIKTGFGFIRNNPGLVQKQISEWIPLVWNKFPIRDFLQGTSSRSVSYNELHPGLILPFPDLTRSGHESTRTIPTQFGAMQYSSSLPVRDSARNLLVMGVNGAISTRGFYEKNKSKLMYCRNETIRNILALVRIQQFIYGA